jgi:hypothetical protein
MHGRNENLVGFFDDEVPSWHIPSFELVIVIIDSDFLITDILHDLCSNFFLYMKKRGVER